MIATTPVIKGVSSLPRSWPSMMRYVIYFQKGATYSEVKDAARKNGMDTLFESGVKKVEKGITSLEGRRDNCIKVLNAAISIFSKKYEILFRKSKRRRRNRRCSISCRAKATLSFLFSRCGRRHPNPRPKRPGKSKRIPLRTPGSLWMIFWFFPAVGHDA